MKEWTSSMSKEETMAIIVKAQELESLGKKEDAAALRIKIPQKYENPNLPQDRLKCRTMVLNIELL